MQLQDLLAERMGRLGTESAFEVLARARALEAQGRSIIHLEIGEPDFDTPPHIVEAAIEALRGGDTHYTPAAGLPELRAAIAEEVSRTRGIPVEPDRVVVTPGGKPIMFFTILALAEEGAEVIYPDPGFPIYESVIRFAGATPVPLPLREELGFAFDPDELRRLVTKRTRLVIVNSPHNPTGAVIGREVLEELARLAQEYGFIVLSDEIYRRIVYDVEAPSIASLPGMAERTVILDGFSKTYAMTGWRLGYGVAPRWLAEHLVRLAVNCHSCVPGFTQRAGLAALRGPQDAVDRMVAEFRRRRDAVVAGLNSLPGVRCAVPAGAFYVFPNVTETGRSASELARELLEQAGVAVLAGTAFGRYGEGYLRLSFANSLENLLEAIERMRRYLG
ncbi:MAG: pyridoxal phosphate-dependent aminotransferase [Thermomicrobium sp.]|nr:pyridoxal phosphate-dependent aminotransferase [Thermomicrobium sp.]MBO9351435.1 pyridoxal phosphate-dependent aminotransferase [Thermomicrobium sp.]MBO9359669.1 pyridoxal phosphate-dependent aminotransferase [Thermomicrobium sp.]